MSGLGALLSPIKTRDYDFYAACGASDIKLPDKFALPIDKYCTVKNQFNVGACVSYALSTVQEYHHNEQLGDGIVWSEGRIYGSDECRQGYEGYGMFLDTAAKGLMKIGFVNKAYFDICVEVPEIIDIVRSRNDLLALGEPERIKGFTRIAYALESKRTEAIMKAIYTYKLPIIAASADFFKGGSHCIVLYGWEKNGNNVKFLFRNSWGKSYKNGGNWIIPASYINEAIPITFADYSIPFVDVNETDWYYKDVKSAVLTGLVNGVSETEFKPNDYIIRGDMALIVSRTLHKLEDSFNAFIKTLNQKGISASAITLKSEGKSFADVALDSYYKDGIEFVCANGIMEGKTESEFDPETHITRAEMATILVRATEFACNLLSKSVPSKTFTINYSECSLVFTDIVSGEWYTEYVDRAIRLGFMKGYDDGTFRPNSNISRAEATSVFNRFFDKVDELINTIK